VAKVIIEYEAQAASLKAVTDTIINANKQISDSAQTSANLANEVYKSLGKSISSAFASKDVQKALDANVKSVNSSKDSIVKLNEESIKYAKAGASLANGIKNTGIEALKANKEISSLQQTIFTLGKNSNNTGEKSQSLKARLAELKAQISALDAAGQSGSDAFEQLSVEAGKLADQASDTQERIRTLASDTFKFDAAIGAVKGLASIFAVAQGAAALFGAENEDLNKTIARTQASVALLTGLNEIANLVAGQGATKIAFENLFLKEKVVVTDAAAVSVVALTNAEEGAAVATLATKKSLDLLKLSIAATGIGALVLVLGALYKIYEQNSEANKKYKAALDESEKSIKNNKETLKDFANTQETAKDNLAILLNQETATSVARKNALKEQQDAIKNGIKPQVVAIQNLLVEQKKLEEQIKKNEEASKTANKSARFDAEGKVALAGQEIAADNTANLEKLANIKTALAKTNAAKAELTKKGNEAALAINAEFDKKELDEQTEKNNKLNDELLKSALNRLKIKQLTLGESVQTSIDIANKESEIEINSAKGSIKNAKLRASTIALIQAQLANTISKINLDATNRAIEDEVKLIEAKKVLNTATIEDEIKQANLSFTAEKNSLEARIKLNQATNADLELLTANHEKKIKDITNRAIQEDYNLRVQAFELRKLLGVTNLEDELSLIRARGEAEIKANESSNSSLEVKEANRKAIIAKTDAAITQAKVVEANKQIDIDNAVAQAAVTLGQSTYEQRVKLIEDEGIKQKNALDKKLLSEEEYNAKVIQINANTTSALKDENDKRIEEAFKLANAVVSVFTSINDISKQASEQRIEDITASSETELQAINDTDALETDKIKARAALEKRTQAAIAKEKTKQAENDKALAIFQAVVSTARAVAEALPNIPLSILVGAAGAIQIAAIASQPIPKFEKGGEIGGKRHSQGGTMVEAEQGEYIVNRKQTSAHRRELNALNQSSEAFKKLINERYVRPALMNYMLNSKSKEVGVNVNATLNSKTMEAELKGLRKDMRQSKSRYYNNSIDSRYQWQ
jgi:hypothetical protein